MAKIAEMGINNTRLEKLFFHDFLREILKTSSTQSGTFDILLDALGNKEAVVIHITLSESKKIA